MEDISLRLLQHASSGLCCSQIMLALALEEQNAANPELVRAMAGLCNGLGDCSGQCGVLLGGMCLLAFHAGKSGPAEQEHERFPLLLQTFADWFRHELCTPYGGCSCSDILGPDNCGKPDQEKCGGLLTTAYGRCLEILVENGIDPTRTKAEQSA